MRMPSVRLLCRSPRPRRASGRAVPTSRESFRGGSPGNADSGGSDADAIGIYPVHRQWTVVDGSWLGEGGGAVNAVSATPRGSGRFLGRGDLAEFPVPSRRRGEQRLGVLVLRRAEDLLGGAVLDDAA